MSDSRERFEAEAAKLGYDLVRHSDETYATQDCYDAWQLWQAAERDALERVVKVCEALADRTPLIGERSGALKCATAIRALAGKE